MYNSENKWVNFFVIYMVKNFWKKNICEVMMIEVMIIVSIKKVVLENTDFLIKSYIKGKIWLLCKIYN